MSNSEGPEASIRSCQVFVSFFWRPLHSTLTLCWIKVHIMQISCSQILYYYYYFILKPWTKKNRWHQEAVVLLRFGCYADSHFPKYHWSRKSIPLNCLLGSYLSKSFTYCRSSWFLVTLPQTKPFSFRKIHLHVNLNEHYTFPHCSSALYVVMCLVLLIS